MDGAPACPFVAFGDDRDGRSTSPDHRHRCFAESPPAPRAVAHQEAYCLSSAFPVCPTFQDWARREAAHARGGGERAETAPTAVPSASAETRTGRRPRAGAAAAGRPDDAPVKRNPPRDWAAPPPWAAGAAAPPALPGGRRHRGPPAPAARPERRRPVRTRLPQASATGRSSEGQGLAGSAADRLAGGADPPRPAAQPGPPRPPGPASADPRRGPGGTRRRPPSRPASSAAPAPAARRLPAADAARDAGQRSARRAVRGRDRRVRHGSGCGATRPTRRSRRGPACRRCPRVAVLAGALGDRRARAVLAAGAARDRWRRRRIASPEPQPAASRPRASPTDAGARADAADLHHQDRATRCRRSPDAST